MTQLDIPNAAARFADATSRPAAFACDPPPRAFRKGSQAPEKDRNRKGRRR